MTPREAAGPSVSVIVPVHNAASTIGATLGSLFAQTLDRLEVIAVDDASRDGSAQVLAGLASREARLKVVSLDQNIGVHEARAAGLRRAQAPWIGFLDADDFARPAMFETLLTVAERQAVDVVVCGSDRVTPDRRRLGTKTSFSAARRFDDGLFHRFCRLEFGNGSLCNKLYRAGLVCRWGERSFPWRQDTNEDTLVNLGVFFDARTAFVLPEVLHEYTFNPASATSTADNHKAFTLLFRAYAIAIDRFADAGDEALASITALYRRQIDYDCYRLPDGPVPAPHAAALAQAVAVLAERCPAALALLAARMPRAEESPDAPGAGRDPGRLLGQLKSRLLGQRSAGRS